MTDADNPRIEEYFKTVRTDPSLDRKGRSWELPVTSETSNGWMVTAWCAAFVCWCLEQAKVPHPGYATASSWLRFGTPLAGPVYGCVTVVKPSRATQSTTGHVAFFTKDAGARLYLLGGNQGGSGRVSEDQFDTRNVLGYRWPTAFDATATRSALA